MQEFYNNGTCTLLSGGYSPYLYELLPLPRSGGYSPYLVHRLGADATQATREVVRSEEGGGIRKRHEHP